MAACQGLVKIMASITYNVFGTAVLGESIENIEGTFIYDPDTKVQSSVNITLTGANGPGPYDGVYADNNSGTNNGRTISAPMEGLPAVILVFETPLTNGIAELSTVAWMNNTTRMDAALNSVTGNASPSE